MLSTLNSDDRQRLMRFVCAFAWADLEVQEEERAFVQKMAGKLGLPAAEIAQVESWLRVPPNPEDVDPSDIPAEHRQLFLDAIRGVIGADHRIARDEAENLRLFELLLNP